MRAKIRNRFASRPSWTFFAPFAVKSSLTAMLAKKTREGHEEKLRRLNSFVTAAFMISIRKLSDGRGKWAIRTSEFGRSSWFFTLGCALLGRMAYFERD
jgi:hypothetical protein